MLRVGEVEPSLGCKGRQTLGLMVSLRPEASVPIVFEEVNAGTRDPIFLILVFSQHIFNWPDRNRAKIEMGLSASVMN